MNSPTISVFSSCVCALAALCQAQNAPDGQQYEPAPTRVAAASSSLMVNTPVMVTPSAAGAEPHRLRTMSMFAIAPPEPRVFRKHDLVQIIVRETSQAKSSQDLETNKESKIEGAIPKFPHITLEDLLNLQLRGGSNENPPELQMEFSKDFTGEGDYERKDDLTARLTAEVLEVLPNGNLVLEARTRIKTDDEEQAIKATGVCRPQDITAANTVLSNQIHDLVIEKMHTGELRTTAKKGVISKVLEVLFAF